MSDIFVLEGITLDLDSVDVTEVPGHVPACCVKLLKADPEPRRWPDFEPPRTREGVIHTELYFLHQLEHHPERVAHMLREGLTAEAAITELRELIQMRGGVVPPRGET